MGTRLDKVAINCDPTQPRRGKVYRELLKKNAIFYFKFAIKKRGFSIFFRSNLRYNINTPGTAGGPGGPDRTLAVKNRKNV